MMTEAIMTGIQKIKKGRCQIFMNILPKGLLEERINSQSIGGLCKLWQGHKGQMIPQGIGE